MLTSDIFGRLRSLVGVLFNISLLFQVNIRSFASECLFLGRRQPNVDQTFPSMYAVTRGGGRTLPDPEQPVVPPA
jgi:hypothetical protein